MTTTKQFGVQSCLLRGARLRGKVLADNTAPIALNKKHLVIAVNSERWEKYLKDLCGQMIFKINSVLGQAVVTFIEFTVDEKAVIEEREKRGGKQFDETEVRELAKKAISPKLRVQANKIKDESLRNEFLKAASISLAKKEIARRKQ